MRTLTKDDYPEAWIPCDNLSVVWAKSQRDLSEAHVRRIQDNLDPDALGTIVVTLPNGDGIHHIIDGQHRVEAVRRLWGGEQRMPCRVLEARDPTEAARIWLRINLARTSPSQIARFMIAVQGKEEPQSEVYGLIRGHGYTVEKKTGEGVLRAVHACVRTRSTYGIVALKRTFEDIQACWGMDRNSTHQAIIMGFGEIHGLHKLELDRARLVSQVKKSHEDPLTAVAQARALRDIRGGTVGANMAEYLRLLYNTGKRTGKLEAPA
jgi:hypothetical protein